ncbi:restriction endonuclease subunit S [Macellibacteroides fermentans]|uniref:restriction endonuclease subunit S n=1 Tax=Macellibacteroides fermentans TaxID=879969 RepID=UPI00406CB63E
MASIGDICEILDSQRKPVTASYRKSGIYPYYGANGIQDFVDSYIFDGEFVLLAEDGGNFGSKEKPIAYRVSGKCWVNNHAHVLKPKGMLNVDYLCYAIMFYDVSDLISGTTRAKLNQSAVRNMQIPLPPLETQKKIADVLDKAKNLIDLRKKQIEKMDLLIKSKFIEMFGDPVTNPKRWREGYIENICDAIVDCPHSTPLHSEIITPYPSVRTSEIKNGAIEWSSMKYVSKDEYLKRIKRITPQPGDIIYGREGTYGDAAILPDGHNFCLGQRVILLRVNKEICNSIYFSSALRSDYVYSQAKLKNVGATVGHVNVKDIKQFIVPLPPLSIQNQFASFVELIEKQKNLFQQALDKMEISYKSLMQEYFG